MYQFLFGRVEDTLVVIDPHGDMVETLRKIRGGKKEIVYVDPVLMKGYTPCINPLECRSQNNYEIELHASQLLSAFQEMMPDTKLSNQMRALLKPCLYVLLKQQTANLIDLQGLLIGKRKDLEELGKACEIRTYREFFKHEYHHYAYDITKQSLYTRLQGLLNSQVFTHMTCGVSTIQLEQLIRKGALILFNLSKGRVGEDISATLGRFLIAKLKTIALSRGKIPE